MEHKDDYDTDGIADFLSYLGSEAPLSNSGFDSLEQYTAWIFPSNTVDEIVALLVDLTDAQSLDEFLASTENSLDGKFEETFNYFEIKLSVSEYKNGN